MQIWIDGDACPKVIKEVLFRAAVRTKTLLTIVANHHLNIPPSPFIKKQLVAAGFDVADTFIVEHIQPGDLVISADILLADAVISKKGFVLNPRGDLYTEKNIKQHLAMRNLNDSLRSCNMISGGAPKPGIKETHAFAANLDKFLALKM